MTFQILALPAAAFKELFDLPNDALARRQAVRVTADADIGFPCRVSLKEAKTGEQVILVNHQHLEGQTPYAASHAIYIREGVTQAQPEPGEIPDVLSGRLLSVRGFDGKTHIRAANVVEGVDLAAELGAMFEDKEIRFIQIHNAKRGCFAASAVRAVSDAS